MQSRIYIVISMSKTASSLGFCPFDDANLGNKIIPTQKKSELGIVIGKLELLLELHYYLMPNFCIKKSATTYCCL